ncbi:uncharacterized protein LOC141764447 isoform X1 [Sebastes fasciatus]|uniref:uncharacterized protein LOC141764447 isoform X1 n=1 Tax=Sebastes fasciatus TaxID=394691 RepID=UPI003D9F78F5
MSDPKLQSFRSFLTERFTSVAVEIFEELESIVGTYYEENKRLRSVLHTVLNPEIKLTKIDVHPYTGATTDVKELITTVEISEPVSKKPKEEQIEYDISLDSEQQQQGLGEADNFITPDCVKNDPKEEDVSWDSQQQQQGLGVANNFITPDCVKNDPEEDDVKMPCITNSFHIKMAEFNPNSSGTLTADEDDDCLESDSDADSRQLSRSEESSSESQDPQKHDTKSKKSLTMLQDLDSDNSDGGELSEVESDNNSDLSWVYENSSSSSESDSEYIPQKKRRSLSPETTDPDVPGDPRCPVLPCAEACTVGPPALGPSEGLSPPLESSRPNAAVEKGKDGTVWTVLQPTKRPGIRQSQNVLTEAAGPTARAKRNVEDAHTAFLCLFDVGMLEHIRDCTVDEAHRHSGDSSWDLTVAELKAFIALLYIRGAKGAKYMDLSSLWSEKWGFLFFKETMSRNRFREIMRFLRFDKKKTRRARLQDDKFALVSATWNKFVQNSIACYKPGANITIDEQLLPCKTRCRFTQYTGNKPDNYGIKFWLAADVQSKYMLNGVPYLGKEDTRSRGQLMGESVVLKLAEPFLGKGRNITTDNFFTSLKLATALQAKKTSLVGTLRKTNCELPPSAKVQAELFHTKVLKCADATLTIYQGKPRENVCILSSMHTSVGITEGQRAKPESVRYYNDTKYGVDVLDQMAKAYSVKGATHRWPVAVFYNILDLAGINAHVLFKECTGSKLPRTKFMQQLAEELRAEFMEGKMAAWQSTQGPGQQQTPKRRQCQVRKRCNNNKTSDTCFNCQRPVCGNCVGRRKVTCFDCD